MRLKSDAIRQNQEHKQSGDVKEAEFNVHLRTFGGRRLRGHLRQIGRRHGRRRISLLIAWRELTAREKYRFVTIIVADSPRIAEMATCRRTRLWSLSSRKWKWSCCERSDSERRPKPSKRCSSTSGSSLVASVSIQCSEAEVHPSLKRLAEINCPSAFSALHQSERDRSASMAHAKSVDKQGIGRSSSLGLVRLSALVSPSTQERD